MHRHCGGAFAVTQAQRGLQGQAGEFAPAESDGTAVVAESAADMQFASAQAVPLPIPIQSGPPDASSQAFAPRDDGYAEEYDAYQEVAPYQLPADDPHTLPPPRDYQIPVAHQPVPPRDYDLPPVAEESAASYEEADSAFGTNLPPIQPAQAQFENELPLTRESSGPVPPAGAYAVADAEPFGGVTMPPAPLNGFAAVPHEEPRGYDAPSQDGGFAGPQEYRNELFADQPSFDGDASFSVPEDSPRMAKRGPSEAEMLSPLEPGNFDDPPPSAGNGQPGPDELQGPQTPSLTIRKTAPREVQVGKSARLDVVVRNVGKIPAHDVLIRDEVPRGTQLIDTTPAANATPDGGIFWQIGTIEPNAEVTVTMNVMPTEEGEIGSVATVSFQVAATARSIVTRPLLSLQHSGPQAVLVGNDVIFHIQLANNGTGAAANVFLEEDVPEGLRHYDGTELEFQVGTLKPGESRVLELKLTADKPGQVRNVLVARGDANLRVQDTYEFDVVAPDLQVTIDGPRRRFLERKATYEISLANPGTAPAKNVELVAKLPPSLKFLSTNNAGHYDSGRHSVTWSLESLPDQEMGTVELNVLPIQMGRFPIRVDAKANMALSDSVTMDVEIEGMAALLYTVTDVNDPIEVGGETTYEVHVVNQGSKAATNLRLAALLPNGMEPVRADGPARVQIEGPRVLFDALPRLAPQGDTMYRIYIRGTTPGDKRVQVKLISDEITEPVTKEESTHVYSDE